MNINEITKTLADRGVSLSLTGENNLDVRVIDGVLDEQLKKLIVDNKPLLVERLQLFQRYKRKKIVPRAETKSGQSVRASFSQENLFTSAQLKGASVYNIPMALRLAGILDCVSLQKAVSALVQRHAILNTHFKQTDDGIFQVISDHDVFDLPLKDFSMLGAREQQQKLADLLQIEAERRYDLTQGPLFIGQLIKFDDQSHILQLSIHHILTDGWSGGVLIRDLCGLYRSYLQGDDESTLPPLPFQYADYALWQREWLGGHELEKQKVYWEQQLAGLPLFLSLPTDRPRLRVRTHHGNQCSFSLSEELAAKLNAVSRQFGTTLFMTLFAAFSVFLYRYSGQADFAIGTPIANRNHPDLDNLIGPFINVLALRSDLLSEDRFIDVLERSRTTTLQAYQHQDMPFEKIVELLNPPRSLSYSPLFQIMFALQNFPMEKYDFPELEVSYVGQPMQTSKFDLSLFMFEADGKIDGTFEYSSDLFDAGTIERMAANFQVLLESIAEQPKCPIHTLPILTPEEYRQVVYEWNDTVTEYPREKCVHQLFEEQVVRTPANVAVLFQDQQLTYAELNVLSNQLAHFLIEQGVKPGVLVALCMGRSLEVIIGILGILKAGGAYVPMDPDYPEARIKFMLEDTATPIVLTQSHLRNKVSLGDRQAIYLDDQELHKSLITYPEGNPDSQALGLMSRHLAYVIYTSGSTGQPKGVMIEHTSFVNYIYHAMPEYLSGDITGSVVSTPMAFDATVTSLYSPLCSGKQVILLQEDKSTLERLLGYVQSEESFLFKITPAHLEGLIIQGVKKVDTARHVVVVGGEKLKRKVLDAWKKLLPGCIYINEYGPTEATVGCSIFRADKAFFEDCNSDVPIGHPINNTLLYVLDRGQQPVPIGVPGELYISGEGLARGYWNRPDLTEASFITNPFSDNPGARMYRTGDLCRYAENGEIEYLGRLDHQVKLRGFRIELGEIEHVLLCEASVKEVMVVAHERKSGDKYLTAYVVLAESDKSEAEQLQELKQGLRQQLPDYMVPTAIMSLEALPLTPNGKVDRKALLPPDLGELPRHEYVAPATETEHRLVDIWSEVLGIPTGKIGIHDNFFALGGHSLLAIQVISRLNRLNAVNASIKVLFECPTIAQLGLRIKSLNQRGRVQELPVTHISREPPLLSSFAQRRLWFLNQYAGGEDVTYNMSLALCLRGNLDTAALTRALNTLVERHESLRTHFQQSPDQTEPEQVITEAPDFEMPVITVEAEEAQEHIEANSRHVFNLSTGPLFRASLLHISGQDYILLICMHHIISDGWSMGVFTKELSTLYQAYQQGKDNPLPALPIQYADYAHWQREWLQGEQLTRQLDYWREQLTGVPPLLDLPLDHPRPAVQTYTGAVELFHIDNALMDKLTALSQECDVTLFMLLLAGFNVLLWRYSGQDDIVVGTPVANRGRPELEGLIGFFVNTLALRHRPVGHLTFKGFLQQVRETTLDAYSYQDIPFEHLVEVLNPERSLSHNPLFQVMFQLQNQLREESGFALPKVEVSPAAQSQKISKFDLTLSINETEEGLLGSIEYNTDLFDQPTIARMADHFQQLVQGIVANPDQTLSALPLLTPKEYHQIVHEWNDSVTEYPREKCVHQLFEEQVARKPDNVAAVFEDQQLTYAELNVRSNQLAHYLIERGVKPDTLVGLCAERSLEMIIGLLGILKAGGAYLPLDPYYPEARLAFMVEDSDTEIVITQEALKDTLSGCREQIILDDEDLLKTLSAFSQTNPVSEELGQRSGHLAYVIYTSGSTGQPKGVMIEHAALHNFLQAIQATPGIAETDKLLAITPISFDIAGLELFLPLLSGAQLHIAGSTQTKDSHALQGLIQKNDITLMQGTPATWQLLLDGGWTGKSDMVVLCGGEAWPEQLATKLRGKVKAQWNMYGPTETTIWSAVSPVLESATKPLIGGPMANTAFYVLDKSQQPVPIGVPGELYISGAGLARGYWNRRDLTEASFIPNPFSDNPGARLYRTGDLCRYAENGKIEYLGRLDHQVKLRGFRIELGEIEHALLSEASVKEAVVVAHDRENGDKHLTAYVVLAHSDKLEAEQLKELKQVLRQRLPDYMVPTAIISLESLPLTPNGKVDRKALLPPDLGEFPAHEYVAPETETERKLVDIWSKVLSIPAEKIGIHDNFFSLGGHSLAVVRVVAAMKISFHVVISIKAFFGTYSCFDLACYIDEITQQDALILGVADRPGDMEEELLL